MKNRRLLLLILSVLFGTLHGAAAFAQDGAVASSQDPVARELKALQEKLDAQDKKLAEQAKQLEAQDQQMKEISDAQAKQAEKNAAIDAQLETATSDRDDLAVQIMDAQAAVSEEKFTVSGFLDLTHTAAKAKQEGSTTFAQNSRYNSFYQTGVNIYFKSQMTNTLSALVETRFSYSPLGQVNSIRSVSMLDGKEMDGTEVPNGEYFVPEGQWSRTDTYVDYQFEGGTNLGGVSIERAYLDWKPRDWFGIRAGRYLTPFGIWNEDHGAPVLLTVSMPYLISWNVVPVAQTGLMAFGAFFPSDLIKLEYALTFSNGRGPTESFYDTDDNKAFGVRAKMILDGNDWGVSLGTYMYYGKYTDFETELRTEYTRDPSDPTGNTLMVDVQNFDLPYHAVDRITEERKEYIGTVDLKIHFKGLTLFGEAGGAKIKYSVAPIDDFTSFTGIEAWAANFITKTSYGILAYQLPLGKVFDTLTITPFVGADYLDFNDANDFGQYGVYRFGLNIKPSPFVTLKANAYLVKNLYKDSDEETWFFKSQIAVSF